MSSDERYFDDEQLIPCLGAEAVNLSFSGLDQSEATWMRRLTRALGKVIPHLQSTHR